MGKVLIAFLFLGQLSLGARQLRGSRQGAPRDARNLQNTFPFNQGGADHAHGHHEHDHSEAHHVVEARPARQGGDDASVSFADVAAASPGSDGKRCIDKVEMVEEIEYDDVVQCDHSYDKRCHTTYVTNYESQQEENVKRILGRAVSLSMSRLLSMRLYRSVEPLWSRTVMFRVLKSAELNMNLSAGPNKRFMMLKMMLLNAKLKLRRSVKMKLLVTPPTQNAQSGLRRFALSPRSLSRNTPPSQGVPRNQGNFVPQQAVASSRVMRSAMTKHKLWYKMLLRKSVTLNPKEPASMSLSLSLSSPLLKNV